MQPQPDSEDYWIIRMCRIMTFPGDNSFNPVGSNLLNNLHSVDIDTEHDIERLTLVARQIQLIGDRMDDEILELRTMGRQQPANDDELEWICSSRNSLVILTVVAVVSTITTYFYWI